MAHRILGNEEIYQSPVYQMKPKTPHVKEETQALKTPPEETMVPFDFDPFDTPVSGRENDEREQNRLKRSAKRRRGRGGKRRNKSASPSSQSEEERSNNASKSDGPASSLRAGSEPETDKRKKKRKKKKTMQSSAERDYYSPMIKEMEATFVEMPKDLYQAHLRPGVIFRIHMSEAIIKMQYRNYCEDKDESVIEADVEYLRLTRKVISDEITKFEDLRWLIGWFHNRTSLIQQHTCNSRYFTVGIPPTMFTHPEEYMKRMCLFDSVYLDHIPYVVGEDESLMAAVAPPVLYCDAATCTSVPFVDSLMFEDRLPRSNVRTMTRCQASCRAHCRNDAECLQHCNDRCLRSE